MTTLRVCACCYLFIAALSAVFGGWSILWALGWLVLALGFAALSFAQDNAQSVRPAWRKPAYSLMAIGIGLLFYVLIRHRGNSF
jgi:hypothetical protein